MSLERLGRALYPLTLPLSWFYGAAVAFRNRRYDRDSSLIEKLPAGVVSVGNLTVGGSGKTPLVVELARELEARGAPVAVLSRGYRRSSRASFILVSDGVTVMADAYEAGDEPVELARRKGLAVAVGADRAAAGRELLERLGPRVLVLDDGFQHRRLHRDLDLVCFDARESATSLKLLPAGRLREPLASLGRADALVWTWCDEEHPREELQERVLQTAGRAIPTLRAVHRVTGFRRLGTNERVPHPGFRDQPVVVLAATARPQRIVQTIEAPVLLLEFRRDHHHWKLDELDAVAARARARGARAILTTGKDAVKIEPLLEAGASSVRLPVYEIELETRIIDQKALQELLDRVPRP